MLRYPWTKDDVFGLLKGIITGKTTGLNLNESAGFTAQVLNPKKLKKKFKALLRKRKPNIDLPPILVSNGEEIMNFILI